VSATQDTHVSAISYTRA